MDRRRRALVLFLVLSILLAFLGIQAVTGEDRTVRSADGRGKTLIAVQSFGWFDRDNGKALVVDRDGDVTWEFDPANTRVFDVERLPVGNVQIAMATRLQSSACPETFRIRSDTCVQNRVVEVDYPGTEIVWEYTWKDAFVTHHEVHDADRLPSGETVIVDMGNNRVFTVARNGTITWSWNATAHLGEGSRFWQQHVPRGAESTYEKEGPESDWTHMNDVDLLANGNFQVSIRNFDVVIEVARPSGRVVDVIGSPGDHETMREQHNPARLANGTLLVADSENDRIVEIDLSTGEPIWSYVGPPDDRLAWPRDADRLPNGNTLIVDSRNFRVLEINASGAIVWEHSFANRRGIVYDADRLGLPEEPSEVPTAKAFNATGDVESGAGFVTTMESWAGFIFPQWVRFPELLAILGAALASLALVVDVVALLIQRHRGSGLADLGRT